MQSIIFIAPPAAGKGTQAKLVSQKYGIPHISTGDLLRETINSDSEQSKKIKAIILKGGLVDDAIILELIENRITSSDCNQGYILDGFPRNVNQAILYDKLLEKLNKPLGLIILLELNKEIAKNRIVGRLSCKKCGSVYNEFLEETQPKKAGICDKCQTALSKRSDDNQETFEERYNTYLKETQPLIDYYEKTNKLYRINSGISKEYTFKEIESILGSSI